MARQSQKTLANDNLLKEKLRKYLLIGSHPSLDVHDFVNNIVVEHKLIRDNRTIFLEGDPFFCGMVRELFRCWGIEVRDHNEPRSSDDKILDVPGLSKRKEDIPAFASYIFQRFKEKHREAPINIPDSICGETLLFLLSYSLWNGFDLLGKFIEKVLEKDWKYNTITLLEALHTGTSVFKSDEHVAKLVQEHRDIDITRILPNHLLYQGKHRNDTVKSILKLFLLGPECRHKLNYCAENYTYFDPTDPEDREFLDPTDSEVYVFLFPLDSVGQAMMNMQILLGENQAHSDVCGDNVRLIEKITSIRRTLRLHAWGYDGDGSWINTTGESHSCWDHDSERRKAVEEGLCDKDRYDDFVANLHFNLRFPKADTTYEHWKDAAKSLGIHNDNQMLERRTADRKPTEKPVMNINRRTRRIKVTGRVNIDYRAKKRSPDVVDALTFALEQCKEKFQKRRPVFFDRVKLCKDLKISEDCKTAHIFRETPFWPKNEEDRLIKSIPGRNRYMLGVDIQKSKIEYEPH